jgi:hypothetical protein
MAGGADWLLTLELLDRGEPEFVGRLRGIADADALGAFAGRWYSNRSPAARRLLLTYLEQPLNAFRHEPLVKRLFKRAEAAQDDAVMARFLVAFDRSVRRVQRRLRHFENRSVASRDDALQLAALWTAQGYENVSYWEWRDKQFRVIGRWSEPDVTTPGGTTMPRGKLVDYLVGYDLATFKPKKVTAPDWVGKLKLDPLQFCDAVLPPESARKKLERFRLFSVPTRHYLRRRAWRYFRRLGKTHPDHYVAAVSEALVLYQDADVETGLALLDNWGLVHALFHHSPVLDARPRGWLPAEGRSLSELEPAPIYQGLWRSAPRALFDLLVRARCRPVRRWAMTMLARDPAVIRDVVGLEEILGLLSHDDSEVVGWAAERLQRSEGLANLTTSRWLELAQAAGPAAMETLAELMARHIAPEQVALPDAARLAASRPLPLARLGLTWLEAKTPATDDERRRLLGLLEAQSEPLRPALLAWLRSALASAAEFHPEWVLELLDSRHADARAEGMTWFRAEPQARDNVTLWQRLLESPYDDVRLALAASLEARLAGTEDPLDLSRRLDPDRLRLLWAAVLLNVRRGGRAKPGVVAQVARRLEHRPEEADRLLPLLSAALRSLRCPERNAALAAVVRLVERKPEVEPLVRAVFPELQWA